MLYQLSYEATHRDRGQFIDSYLPLGVKWKIISYILHIIIINIVIVIVIGIITTLFAYLFTLTATYLLFRNITVFLL